MFVYIFDSSKGEIDMTSYQILNIVKGRLITALSVAWFFKSRADRRKR